MRLRSSQIVFLLLLVCSVQVQDGCALRLLASEVSRQSLASSDLREATAIIRRGLTSATCLAPARLAHKLDPAEKAFFRTPRRMPAPATASAAIASHTALERA